MQLQVTEIEEKVDRLTSDLSVATYEKQCLEEDLKRERAQSKVCVQSAEFV